MCFSAIDRCRARSLHVHGTSACMRRACVCAKRSRGKKCSKCAPGSRSGRGSCGIRKFNPLVCGFFAIPGGGMGAVGEAGGRSVEFVGGLATGFAYGTFARELYPHRAPSVPLIDLCELCAFVFAQRLVLSVSLFLRSASASRTPRFST